MPYIKDFSTLRAQGSFDVNVPKWVGPLTIEYGYDSAGPMVKLYWRVAGTSHTFSANYYDIMEATQGDYESHISTVLQQFRKDYLSWANQGFYADWMREYHEEYGNLIEI
jgi:hypothetical protein